MARGKTFLIAVLDSGNGFPFPGMLKYLGRPGGVRERKFFHALHQHYRQKPGKQEWNKPPSFFKKNIDQPYAEKPTFSKPGEHSKYLLRFGRIQRNKQQM